jgi:hypothetical protein
MSNDATDIILSFEAEERRRREKLPAAKAVLLAALKKTRAASVTIVYDGEGDSGQIGDITAKSAGARRPLKLSGTVSLDLDGTLKEYASLEEAIEQFAWDVLHAYHDGFENNEGGYGTITIDVAKGMVTIDHNDRIIDVFNTMTEV